MTQTTSLSSPGDLVREFSSHQMHVLEILVRLFGAISMLCSFLILTLYVAFKGTRTSVTKMLCFKVIANFFMIFSIVFYRDGVGDQEGCLVQGMVFQITALANCLWTLAMALTLIGCFLADFNAFRKLEFFLFQPLCWLLPLVFAVVIASKNWIRDSGLW